MSVPPALTPLEVLHDVDTGGYPLPADLQTLYGGPLRFAPGVLYGNFVASIDGVVAIRSIRSPGSLIGAHSVGDRFVMGLLRACADAVLIGAGTLRDVSRHRWTPAGICPELAASYGELRRRLRKAAGPSSSPPARNGPRNSPRWSMP